LRLTSKSPVLGSRLRERAMPDGARVALVVRGDSTFVPDGDMVLTDHDVLLVAVAPDTAPTTLVAWATDRPTD
jgi:Trk K+ transport system NAD-binding subunit